MEPYLSPPRLAVVDELDADRPEGTYPEGVDGTANVGASVLLDDFVGVAAFDGGSKTLANGEGLVAVGLSAFGVSLSGRGEDSPTGVPGALSPAAFASRLLSAFAFALASLSSIA